MNKLLPFKNGWKPMVTASSQSTSCFDRAPDRILRKNSPQLAFYSFDKERIYVTEPTQGNPRANIILVHGLTEHAARHFNTARWLAALGFRTIQLDWTGHGGREAPLDASWWIYQAFAQGITADVVGSMLQSHKNLFPEAVDEFATQQFHVLSQTTMADHLAQFDLLLNQLLCSQWHSPELPLFLFGHSMGGLLTTETAIRWHNKLPNLKGVILSSPAFKPQGRPNAWLENQLIETLWAQRRTPSALLRRIAKGALRYNLTFPTSWSAPYISDEIIEQKLYLSDPLIPTTGPSKYASSIEDQMILTEPQAPKFPTDALMLVPGQDGVTSVSGAIEFATRAQASLGPKRFSLVRYQQSYSHDLLRSSLRRPVQQTITQWLSERL